MKWSRSLGWLMICTGLMAPPLASGGSQVRSAAAGGMSVAAHLDFRVIIPRVLSLDTRAGALQTVSIFSNSRNVTLAATLRHADGDGVNVILSAAAGKEISQDAACSRSDSRRLPAGGAARLVCTAAIP